MSVHSVGRSSRTLPDHMKETSERDLHVADNTGHVDVQ